MSCSCTPLGLGKPLHSLVAPRGSNTLQAGCVLSTGLVLCVVQDVTMPLARIAFSSLVVENNPTGDVTTTLVAGMAEPCTTVGCSGSC